MKAQIIKKICPVEQNPLQLVDLPVPEPDEGQLLLKVLACGVCHTELDEVEGRLTPPALPIIPGHQVVGRVTDVGAGVTQYSVGDRVGVTWLYSSCGQCDSCASGNENLCPDARWTGKDANGGYAEYMTVPADFAYPIPDEFTDSNAAPLLCAGVIGYRTIRLSQISNGQNLGIFGFGASAHIVIQVLQYKYPDSPVYVFTKTEEHADLARSLGAVWTGRSGDTPPVKLDRIMDFTPAAECVGDALLVLAPGGRLVINAIRKTAPVGPLDYASQMWLEKEIKSVANVTRRDAEEFLPLAARIPIEPSVQKFTLDQAGQALILLKNSQIHGAAVLSISGD